MKTTPWGVICEVQRIPHLPAGCMHISPINFDVSLPALPVHHGCAKIDSELA
jgi:hypothetical protein